MRQSLTIIGGGLAGSEAAWQAARRGISVDLYEMRPIIPTPVHRTGMLAELVCSNSLKSDREHSASWLLKEELRRAGSLLLQIARESAVPAGQALAVDRDRFSSAVTQAIESEPLIRIHRAELCEIPAAGPVIIASGPLTSDALAAHIQNLTGCDRLFFYDSISPIVDASTIDFTKVFAASRYDFTLTPDQPAGSSHADGDYLNCPMNQEQYQGFYDALLAAEEVTRHDFEQAKYFEACLPIEEIARRGRDTLRFGPMKPVGLVDPRTGRRPYAVVQLRKEDLRAGSYNLVGFQNHMKFGEQKRVLQMIPGLENAEFLRYGQIHRNTYINAPALLSPTLQLRDNPQIFFAGQICGVEGYVESIATGLLAGICASLVCTGQSPIPPPRASAIGSLCHYVSCSNPKNYQPANIAFDLLPPLDEPPGSRKLPRPERRARQCSDCLSSWDQWLMEINGSFT